MVLVFFYILIYSIRDDVRKHIVRIGRAQFLVNATVVDVDPKSPEHFIKYIKQTDISHKVYLDTFERGKKTQ